MTRVVPLVALLFSLAAVGGTHRGLRPAEACDCHDGGPVCEDFWKAPVVFLGRVSAIVPLSQPTLSDPHERVEFQVLEAFRGTSAARIELFNYSTTCHHGFDVREEWMIYAYPRHDGPGLTTGTCSRTRPRSNADVDLSYARVAYSKRRTASKTPERGLLLGTVEYRTEPDGKFLPLAGVKLTAHQQWSTDSPSGVTNREGKLELSAPPGAYRVVAEPPTGWLIPSNQAVVQLEDARGCAAATFYAERSRNQSRVPEAAR